MGHVERADSRFGFFQPFFETGRGQIFGLAARNDQIRDGLGLAQLARNFPLPEFGGISIEPGRPNIQPQENIILLGSSRLFADPEAHRTRGAPPLGLGEAKLGERLRRIYEDCCFSLTSGDERVVRNAVTGAVYRGEHDEAADLQIDYAVIRRVFRGPVENTIILEGLHGLGTLGAAKVATSQLCLDALWNAVQQLPGFDESLPLEVLVRADFQPRANLHVFTLDAVRAVPLLLIYNRRVACDMTEAVRWKDQLPWDIHLTIRSDQPPSAVRSETYSATPLPRLELQADLRGLDGKIEQLCRAVWCGTGRKNAHSAELLLERLTAQSDRFRIALIDEAPWGPVKAWELPKGRPTASLGVRKQFFLGLALGRALGLSVRCDDASIRRWVPKFRAGASKKPFADQFIAGVPGKLRDCFEPLLGSTRDRKHYVQIETWRKERRYELRLERAALVVKLRV